MLQEPWTGVSSSGAYWNPTRVLEDTRLPALATDVSEYLFAPPAAGGVTVRTVFLLRRAFKALVDQKGWDAPDRLMGEATVVVGG